MRSNIIDTEKVTVASVIREFFLSYCIGFTVLMLASMLAATLFSGGEGGPGVLRFWGLVGAMLVATLLQLVFFTPVLIKRMGYGARVALFGICLYVPLIALAASFRWFPPEYPMAWVSFSVIYLVILAIMTLIFTGVYHREERRLNAGLERFKARGKSAE